MTEFLRLQRPRPTMPGIMGILNVTPDSFSDGGHFADTRAALRRAEELLREGADLIDVGGESTRPGARCLGVEEELARVLPVVDALARGEGIPVSIDTRKPQVMRAAVAAGACVINDVNALRAPGALRAARDLDVPVVLMHMRGTPETMQQDPHYDAVVPEVLSFLRARVMACEAAGIKRDNLMVDPGFGFGKRLHDNLDLLAFLDRFRELGLPLLVGLSRKGMIGRITGRGLGERSHASVALAVAAVERGADWVRVHDVAATRDALLMLNAIWARSRGLPLHHCEAPVVEKIHEPDAFAEIAQVHPRRQT